MNFICVSTFRDASKRSEKKKREKLEYFGAWHDKRVCATPIRRKKKKREREVSWSEV